MEQFLSTEVIVLLVVVGLGVVLGTPFLWGAYSSALTRQARINNQADNNMSKDNAQHDASIRAINRGDSLVAQNAIEEQSKVSAQTPIHYPGWRPDPERSAANQQKAVTPT